MSKLQVLRLKYPHLNQILLLTVKFLLVAAFVGAFFGLVWSNYGAGRSLLPPRDEWTDYRERRYDAYQGKQAGRTGRGEQGASVVMSSSEKDDAADHFDKEGMNIVASDVISLERSLPDYRSKEYRVSFRRHTHSIDYISYILCCI